MGKQDHEVEFLQCQNKELSNKVEALNWQLSEVEDQRSNEVRELTNKLAVFSSQGEGEADTNQLKLEVASLQSQLVESQQECDKLRSDIMVLSQSLTAAQSE